MDTLQEPRERAHPGIAALSSPWHVSGSDPRIEATFRFLADARRFPAGKARELGRVLGLQAPHDGVASHVEGFSELGVGRLALNLLEVPHYLFLGHDLRGSEEPNAASCALALGYLEGVVEILSGRPAQGTEVLCRSRGHAHCAFSLTTPS